MFKRCAVNLFFLLVLSACFIYSRECSEFSGQTVPFTLSPGETAGWNSATPVLRSGTRPEKKVLFSVSQNSTGQIGFTINGSFAAAPIKIALFTISGRYLGVATMRSSTYATFSGPLSSGIFLARCMVDGTVVHTSRICTGRQP